MSGLYFAQPGHFISGCPVWPKGAGPSVAVGVLAGQESIVDKSLPLDQLLLPVSLCVGGRVLPLQALVDSGAQDSLLDKEVAVQAGCSLEPL